MHKRLRKELTWADRSLFMDRLGYSRLRATVEGQSGHLYIARRKVLFPCLTKPVALTMDERVKAGKRPPMDIGYQLACAVQAPLPCARGKPLSNLAEVGDVRQSSGPCEARTIV